MKHDGENIRTARRKPSLVRGVVDIHVSFEEDVRSVTWGDDLSSVHEAWLVAYVKGPLVVTHYPKALKAFYMKPSQDGQTVEAMDVLLPGWGEVAGGSVREEDADALEFRMRECGMDPALYPAYIALRRAGSVPHAGFAWVLSDCWRGWQAWNR